MASKAKDATITKPTMASKAKNSTIPKRTALFFKIPMNMLLWIALAEVVAFHLYTTGEYTTTTTTPTTTRQMTSNSFVAGGEDEFISILRNQRVASQPFVLPSGPPRFERLQIPALNKVRSDKGGVNATIERLLEMGVTEEEIDSERDSLPPWSQVLDNYGEEPIILGLERCQAYRESIPPNLRKTAPAGLFSTGTNLIQTLLTNNCLPPGDQSKAAFTLWQAPWGKHNPSTARLKYWPPKSVGIDHNMVLPIVAVRHPLSWMHALCKHYYGLLWMHDKRNCDATMSLFRQVNAKFGSNKQTWYDSLVHVWRDWNLIYLREQNYPLIMVRHEDLVFRPKPVIEKICACVGGRLTKEFSYKQENANFGGGHGKERSGLVSAWIKYGQPLSVYNKKYTRRDWVIIRKVLGNDFGLLKAFDYQI